VLSEEFQGDAKLGHMMAKPLSFCFATRNGYHFVLQQETVIFLFCNKKRLSFCFATRNGYLFVLQLETVIFLFCHKKRLFFCFAVIFFVLQQKTVTVPQSPV